MKISKEKRAAVLCAMYVQYMVQITTFYNAIILNLLKTRQNRKRRQKKLICYKLQLDTINLESSNKRFKLGNKKRSYDFWERIVLQQFTEDDWIENFRVSKETFKYIVNMLKDTLAPKENFLNNHRKICSTEKKVAVSLYYLGSCCEYRLVGNAFGIHKSTVHNIVHEFVNAVNKVLMPLYVEMPNIAKAIEISSFFEVISKLPNIIGAIDGTHIPILPPSNGYRDFINRKGWPSIILQTVVDSKYRFIDLCVKNPGSTHDAAVLTTSNLYRNNQACIPQGSVQLEGREIPYIILGDPAYPLLPWLLKPYANRGGLTAAQDSFNVYTSASRVAVEIAFGRLKARWRTLLKRCDMDYKFVPNIVAACCTLHNIIESKNDKFCNSWMNDVQNAEIIFPQPPCNEVRIHDAYDAHNLRDFLCDYLARNYPLRASRPIT